MDIYRIIEHTLFVRQDFTRMTNMEQTNILFYFWRIFIEILTQLSDDGIREQQQKRFVKFGYNKNFCFITNALKDSN